MEKSNKKTIFVMLIIGLALAVFIVSMFINVCNEKSYWQKNVAEHNCYHWSEINLMATQIENIGFTKETIKENYLYINAKVFSSTTELYPVFSGDSPYYAFLQTYYISLAQDIAFDQDLYGDKLQEAIDLFADATKELKNLSAKILEMTEDAKDKVSLRKVNSKLYNQVEKMIKEYCNKYGQKISDFNNSY